MLAPQRKKTVHAWYFDLGRKDFIRQLCRFIKRRIDDEGWSFVDVAYRAGVTNVTVARYYDGDVTHPWIDKFLAVLGPGLQCEVSLELTPMHRTHLKVVPR